MKPYTIIAITSLLAATVATEAAGAPRKSGVQYEVCAVEPTGKLGVYEVTEKRPEAMAIAKYLTSKQKRAFFVVVEEVTEKGDVK
jgi:hypothetical protein